MHIISIHYTIHSQCVACALMPVCIMQESVKFDKHLATSSAFIPCDWKIQNPLKKLHKKLGYNLPKHMDKITQRYFTGTKKFETFKFACHFCSLIST